MILKINILKKKQGILDVVAQACKSRHGKLMHEEYWNFDAILSLIMSSRPFWGLEWDLVSIFPPTKEVKEFPVNVDSTTNKN